MWEERAYRARREITALAASGLGVSDLHAEAMRVIGHDVRTELTCWAALDPESLVISMMTSGEPRIPPQFEPLLADAEYSLSEPHTFAAMAKRKEALTRMSDLPLRDQERSARYQNVWRPLGVNQELRVLFDFDGSYWGAAGLVRTGLDFTARELEYLAAVAPTVALATRAAVRTDLTRRGAGPSPAIVIVSSDGEVRSTTAEAQVWEERLNSCDPGRFLVMMRIMARGAQASGPGGFRARMSDGLGDWAIVQASTLTGRDRDGEVAISIESAGGEQLTSMLLAAYGLSPRESEICREVIAGHSTTVIAQNLYVSPNTVQDHLKSAFTKVNVRSRGELVARLQPRPTAEEVASL